MENLIGSIVADKINESQKTNTTVIFYISLLIDTAASLIVLYVMFHYATCSFSIYKGTVIGIMEHERWLSQTHISRLLHFFSTF